jgi:hypothetical protein
VKAAFNQLLCVSIVIVATNVTCEPDGTDMKGEWANRRRFLSYSGKLSDNHSAAIVEMHIRFLVGLSINNYKLL